MNDGGEELVRSFHMPFSRKSNDYSPRLLQNRLALHHRGKDSIFVIVFIYQRPWLRWTRKACRIILCMRWFMNENNENRFSNSSSHSFVDQLHSRGIKSLTSLWWNAAVSFYRLPNIPRHLSRVMKWTWLQKGLLKVAYEWESWWMLIRSWLGFLCILWGIGTSVLRWLLSSLSRFVLYS